MITEKNKENTINKIANSFLSIGYNRSLIKKNYSFSDFLSVDPALREISLAVFGQEPMDYRSACFGLEFSSDIPSEIAIERLRAFGAPQIFLVQNGNTQWWSNKEKKAVFKENIKTKEIPTLIVKNSEEWKPENLMRIKSGFKAPLPQQLDFIDIGLLPALEHQASIKIDSLIRRILYNAEITLKQKKTPFDAPSIFNIVFRFLTAKLLKDKDVSITPEINFSNPSEVLNSVEGYYGEGEFESTKYINLSEKVLKEIAGEIDKSFSLRNLSVDTLAYVYENTFVSDKNREKLSKEFSDCRCPDN